LRPELRELDALLLEDGLVLAGDEGVADLPVDLVERIAARNREVPAYAETPIRCGNGVHERLVGDHGSFFGACCGRHLVPSIVSVALPSKNAGFEG